MAVTFLTLIDKQALESRIEITPTDDIFFDIDNNGIISLKPVYRGRGNASSPYSVSDLGAGKEGTEHDKLPERIVIPPKIGGKEVKGYQAGMFRLNYGVKEIVLLDSVTTIPNDFCRAAIELTSVKNTKKIKTIGSYAFAQTLIEEMYLPNLQTLGEGGFNKNPFLKTVDIGNVITAISKGAFEDCMSLISVKGGAAVKTINIKAFSRTTSLVDLPLLKEFAGTIDNGAFYNTRLEIEFENPGSVTVLDTDDTLHTLPTTQHGENKFWEEFKLYDAAASDNTYSYKPCKTPIVSLLDIQGTDTKNLLYFGLSDGKYSTAGIGDSLETCAHIYSALKKEELTSVMDFEMNKIRPLFTGEEAVTSSTTAKSLAHKKARYTKLGFGTVSEYSCSASNPFGKEDLKRIYDTLSAGGCVEIDLLTTSSKTGGGNAVMLYGVNSSGEVLVADPKSSNSSAGVYIAKTYAVPLQNIVGSITYYILVKN